jgi:NAD(P)-dependent dehydrogenase (short-subunit alcohol dehydrogenase family)
MAPKEQRVALVVGASRGIGRQVAIDLAKNGYAGTDILHTQHLYTYAVAKPHGLQYTGKRMLTDHRCIAVVVAAKSISDPSRPASSSSSPPDPKSQASTITTVAHEITSAGGVATAVQVDVRYPESVQNLVDKTISVS